MVTRDNHCTRCYRWSYFKLHDAVCSDCKAKAKRLADAKARYKGKSWNHMDLIQLYWRSNFNVHQVAEILDETEDTIRFEIEICRQNAR